MDHYGKALELLGRADNCDIYETSDGELHVLLIAALTHAVLALTDAVECTRPWREAS
jgi:hypothetical protein